MGNFDARGVRTALALGQWLQEQDIVVDEEGKQVAPASHPKVAIATSGRASSMPVKRRGMGTKVDPLHDPFAGMASGGRLTSSGRASQDSRKTARLAAEVVSKTLLRS